MPEEESIELINRNQDKLHLSALQLRRWAEKRYLVLITVANVEEITAFTLDKSNYSNMDDWLAVGNIEAVMR